MNSYFALWAIFTAFWCWGVVNAFREGEILGGPGKIMRKTFPEWLSKPLFDCQLCTPSVHGTIWFLYFHEWNFMLWILFIVSISGFNYALSKLQYE